MKKLLLSLLACLFATQLAAQTLPNPRFLSTWSNGGNLLLQSQKGVANGIASLDLSGYVPLAQLPPSITGGLSFQGNWNASTNSPALTSSVGTVGNYYFIATAGTTTLNGTSTWAIGDLVLFSSGTWNKIPGPGAGTGFLLLTGGTLTGNLDIAPGAGWGVIREHPVNVFGTMGGNLTQHESSFNIQSSTVDPTSPVISGYRSTITTTTGTTADAWAILGTAATTSTTPVPGGGALGSGQAVGVTGQYVRYNFAPGGNTVNPEGWGGVFTHSDFTGMPSNVAGGGLVSEHDYAASGADPGGLRGGVILAMSRYDSAASIQAVTATSSNGSPTLTSVGTNLTGGATITGYAGQSVVGWTVDGANIPTGAAVLSVTSTTITMNANATGASTGTFNLRPTAQFGTGFGCATGGFGVSGFSPSAVNVANCFKAAAYIREAAFDTRQSILIGSANGLWLGDNDPIAFDTAGAVKLRYNTSTSRIEWVVGGGVVNWLDSLGNALFTGATLFNTTSGLWSSSNLSKALVVTASSPTTNPAIGLFDANNANGAAILSSVSGVQILAMPALSNSATAPVTMATISRTGVFSSGASSGVSCSGTPTSSFAAVGGIVTHC